MEQAIQTTQKKSFGKLVIEQITGIFFPLVGIITATSIIKSILILLVNTGVLTTDNGIYQIFYGCADGFFYFLPFFLAYTASKQWKTNPFISMLIPVTMLYPDIVAVLENGIDIHFARITMPATIYHSSVLPVLLAVGLLHFVEIPCDKWLPEAIKGFLKPIICCIIVLPITFSLLGSIGNWIGSFVAGLFFSLYERSAVLAGAFMGFVIQPMVVFGAQWSILPACFVSIANEGYDVILPLIGGAAMAQGGSALAVAMLYGKEERFAEKKRIAKQACFTAILGVTEPALFGVNVALVRPLLAGCVAGAVGGAMVGLAGTHCYSFAFPSIFTSVAYVGPGFLTFLISMPVGFVLAFLLTMAQGKAIRRKFE